MKKILFTGTLALFLTVILVGATPAGAQGLLGRGTVFFDGAVARTLVPPAPLPHGGVDPIYVFPGGGADGQLSVAGVGPGDRDYHGGRWAVYTVAFSDGVTPYLLTSDEEVHVAEAAGDIVLTRTPENDVRCPVLR